MTSRQLLNKWIKMMAEFYPSISTYKGHSKELTRLASILELAAENIKPGNTIILPETSLAFQAIEYMVIDVEFLDLATAKAGICVDFPLLKKLADDKYYDVCVNLIEDGE